MRFDTLYGKTSSGKLQIWEVFTEGNAITVRHGQLGGKIQEKTTYATAKNIGKANETTPERQAELEAEAKLTKQLDRGYFRTKEEALDFKDTSPMKAQNFNDYEHKVKYNCYIQPKLNGMRFELVKKDGVFVGESKAGLDSPVLPHWIYGLKILDAYGFVDNGLDGEIYAGLQSEGGLSLQEIISAYRKYNENTAKLEYHVYDIPVEGETFDQRAVRLANLYNKILTLENEGIKLPIKVVWTGLVERPEEANRVYQYLVDQGYEGMMYRNADGVYEFGKRSYDLIKRKPRQTTEALVTDSHVDKNEEGVLDVRLQNGVTLSCKMRKDASLDKNYRDFKTSLELIGRFIEVEFEEYSDAGVPTKPVGVRVRSVNKETWEAISE